MSRAKFLSDKQIFLRTFHDQNRRRQVVDQCSLWKERPLDCRECNEWKKQHYMSPFLKPVVTVQYKIKIKVYMISL